MTADPPDGPGRSPAPIPVKEGQTTLLLYRLARGEYQCRYYVGGEARRFTRSDLADAKAEARRIARAIEDGRAQAAALSAGEVDSYVHARRLLGPDAPPLHAVVEEWLALRKATGGASVHQVAAAWERMRAGGFTPIATEDAVETFLRIQDGRGASEVYLRGLRDDLRRFAAAFRGRDLHSLSAAELEAYLRALPGAGARRQDNVRGGLVTLFRHGRDQRWLLDERRVEPEKIPKVSRPGDVDFYRPAEMRAFLGAVREKWLPWLVLGAFAGLRTSEIFRLRWEDFDWPEGRILVRAKVAKKVNKPRRVPIEENLGQWLAPWRQATGPLYDVRDAQSSGLSKETARLSRPVAEGGAGVKWRENNLRHACATYRMALDEDAGKVSQRLGNSPAKLRTHYDGVASRSLALEWFAIRPERAANVVAIGSRAAV